MHYIRVVDIRGKELGKNALITQKVFKRLGTGWCG